MLDAAAGWRFSKAKRQILGAVKNMTLTPGTRVQQPIHPLLERQLRKSGIFPVPDALKDFIAMVNASYDLADAHDVVSRAERPATPPAELLRLLKRLSAARATHVDATPAQRSTR